MNSTEIEIQSLLAGLRGDSGINTISGLQSSHILLEVLKIVTEMSEEKKVPQKLNTDPPGLLLTDRLRIDTQQEMIQYACVFGNGYINILKKLLNFGLLIF